jgi:porphobilinogen deaminase
MGKVIASASMSLDGYIAKDDNTIGRLFTGIRTGTSSSRRRRNT